MNDILPSWHDTPTKQAILDFVAAVTDESGPHYVPPAERIAVFDNDGTLWCEQPAPAQFYFGVDRVQALAPQHPDVKLGAFPPALDEQAQQGGWVVASMKDDWKQIFPA